MTDINNLLLSMIMNNCSTDEICKKMNISRSELKRRIQSLKYEGFNITRTFNYSGSQNYILNKNRLEHEGLITIEDDLKKSSFKAVAVADSHIGHSKYNKHYGDLIYEYCDKNNLNIVFNCGDMLHGTKQYCLNPKEQLVTLLEEYPCVPNILTFFAFGNHEEAFLNEFGINLGSVIERYRDDIIPLGYGESIIRVNQINDNIVLSHINHDFESSGVRLAGHSHRFKFVADDYDPIINVPTLSDFLHTCDYPGAVEMYIEPCNEKVRYLLLKHLVIDKNKIKQVSKIEHKSCKIHVRK